LSLNSQVKLEVQGQAENIESQSPNRVIAGY